MNENMKVFYTHLIGTEEEGSASCQDDKLNPYK